MMKRKFDFSIEDPDPIEEVAKVAKLVFEMEEDMWKYDDDDLEELCKPPDPVLAAKQDAVVWSLCQWIQRRLCRNIARCGDRRCRRRKACQKLARIDIEVKASHARLRLAAAQANEPSPVPSPPPLQSPRGRKKGRTGVRP
jgi:hypothetical protein